MSEEIAIEIAIEKLKDLKEFKLKEVGKCSYTIAIDVILKQLKAHKDKYSDLKTDYARSLENEKTLRYTVNKYYDEIVAHKDKEEKIREYLEKNISKFSYQDIITTDQIIKDGLLQILDGSDENIKKEDVMNLDGEALEKYLWGKFIENNLNKLKKRECVKIRKDCEDFLEILERGEN